MEDKKLCMEQFLNWIRENKRKEYQIKKLLHRYVYWKERWMSVGGINYGVERVQGGRGKDPHLEAFDKMYDIEIEIKKLKKELTGFYAFRDSLTDKQKSFFDEVLIKNKKASEYCIRHNVSLSRGYELKKLIAWKWKKRVQ